MAQAGRGAGRRGAGRRGAGRRGVGSGAVGPGSVAQASDVGVERTVPGTHPKVENLFIFSAGTFRQKLAAIVRLEVQKDEAAV